MSYVIISVGIIAIIAVLLWAKHRIRFDMFLFLAGFAVGVILN